MATAPATSPALTLTTARALAGPALEGAGRLSVRPHPRSGRNRLFTARRAGAGAVLVKQSSVAGAEAGREIDVLRRLAGLGAAPSLVAADEAAAVAVIRWHDGEALDRVAAREPARALAALVDLAEVLAAVHRSAPAGALRPHHPVTPELDPVRLHDWVQLSPAARSIVRRVQQDPSLAGALRAARRGEGESLVHGDVKLDNVLLDGGRPLLVDWELAGAGPAALDLGAVLGSMLGLWVDRLDLDPEAPVDAWLAGGDLAYGEVVAAGTAFLERYEAAAAAVPPRDEVAEQVVAWLVGRAFAECFFRTTAPATALLLLVVASNLRRRGAAWTR